MSHKTSEPLKGVEKPADDKMMSGPGPRWPDGKDRREDPARFGGAGEAMHAVSRLLGSAGLAEGPAAVAQTLVSEARRFFRVDRAILISLDGREGTPEITAMDPARATETTSPSLSPGGLPALATLLSGADTALVVSGDEASALGRELGAQHELGAALLLPLPSADNVPHVLILADAGERLRLDNQDLEVARAFASAAAASLVQLQLASESAAQTARQASLARAARTLNESLDLNRVLVRICEEAASILDADYANVFLGNAAGGLRFEATAGLPPELIGARVATGEGLVGQVIERDEPMLTNDYQALPRPVALPQFSEVRSSLAVPMHWDSELRGALAVGYFRSHRVGRDDLALLEAFAELAAVACRNASAHAGLVLASRTDALTGCLNHAALHDTLRRELERCRRSGHSIALAIVDLDDFKQVNERHGHLAGDEVLRRVGQALRHSVRPYDLVARYGGDEFAIVAIDADEDTAAEVATRAIEGVGRALDDGDQLDRPAGATAGVAQWQAGEGPTALIARADRALLFGKQRGKRGTALKSSRLPPEFQPAGQTRSGQEHAGEPAAGSVSEQAERLRKRTRQLALANALAGRLAGLVDPQEISEAAVDELHRAFEYFIAAVMRIRGDGYVESVAVKGVAYARLGSQRWAQPVDSGLIGRCVREGRPVLTGDVSSEPDYRLVPGMVDVRSELATPIWAGAELWGVIDVEEVRADAFDEDDVRVIETVAHQIGSALRLASLHASLERARLGSTDALAAVMDARDGRRSRPVEVLADAVGERLGMGIEELRTLRFATRFHDIGKIALPPEMLRKPSALTEEERAVMEHHPVAAERILSPLGFLDDVRGLVRHQHERWDGGGYPDGLAGDEIPLGSRVILACSAYDAMLSERPYRPARTPGEARGELRRCAGTQFDSRVVEALLAVLDAQAAADSESSSARQSRSTLAS